MFVFEGDVLVEYFLNWNSKNNKSPLDHEITPQFILKISSAIQLLELVFMAFSFNKKQICEHDSIFVEHKKQHSLRMLRLPDRFLFYFWSQEFDSNHTWYVSRFHRFYRHNKNWVKKKHIILRPKKRSSCLKKHSKKGVIIFPPWNYQLPFWKMMVCQFNTTFLFGAWQMFRGYVCFREIEIATFSVHVGLVSWWRVDLIYFDQSRRLWRKKWIGWAKA